jgi:hypothetical protein
MLCLLFVATMAQGKERITLVNNGVAKYVIRTDQNNSILLKAANVINEFTKLSTGTAFGFQSDERDLPAIILEQVLIDKTYPEDSYSIQFIGANMYIKGSGNGVLYGAYRYVRDVIGGRKWYTGRENTSIPKSSSLRVDAEFYVFAKPHFQFREVYFPIELDQEYLDWYGLHNLEEKWGDWGHTFNKILPPSVYFKEHPEYYSLYNGKRQATQLCLSNEAVFEHTVAYFKQRMLENPQATYWSIAQNDDIGSCTCEQCQAIDRQEGGAQGSLIHFVNRVAAKFPDKKFTTLAYLQTANAPAHLHVAENVSVILSNIDAFRKGDIGTEPSAAAFRKQLRDWKIKAKHVFVWDYLTQFTNYLAPFPVQGTLQKNLDYLKHQGAEGVFLQGGGSSYSDMAELNAYILAHLVWDSTISENQLTDEFVSGYYGKSGSIIKTYLNDRRNALPAVSSALSIYGNPIDNRNDYLSPEKMDHYSTLLEKAEVMSEGNALLEQRIRRLGLGLDYTYLQQARFYGPRQHGIFTEDNGEWKVRPSLLRKLQQFVDDAKKLGVIELAEGGVSPDQYANEWNEIFSTGVLPNNASEAKMTMKYPFDPSFPANGARTLTDSVPGYLDYSYNWLLWTGEPMEITFNFEKTKRVDSVELNFLQDARHWIFLPKVIRITASKDGENFKELCSYKIEKMEEDYTVQKVKFKAQVADDIKIIHVYAMPFSSLPEWRYHPKRKVSIACDEILVK